MGVSKRAEKGSKTSAKQNKRNHRKKSMDNEE
jgi:hypothetical protein